VDIRLEADHVWVDGRDVSQEIRQPEITSVIHYVADNPQVRSHLVELQRQAAAGKDMVTEGRDQGTVVFPHAECKIFLTATDEERARRRRDELLRRGDDVSQQEVLQQIRNRDQRDSTRPVGRLMRAPDAIEFVTDGLSLDEVVNRLEQLVREKLGI
jgi:cytidylate kinase/pantoate ligase/cytidylate kinase